ncbi:MAG: hypothetical protein K8T90_12790 [Planctomycetes bacterium]|nr:hypothetical protein [Planctomycetota bacterium]
MRAPVLHADFESFDGDVHPGSGRTTSGGSYNPFDGKPWPYGRGLLDISRTNSLAAHAGGCLCIGPGTMAAHQNLGWWRFVRIEPATLANGLNSWWDTYQLAAGEHAMDGQTTQYRMNGGIDFFMRLARSPDAKVNPVRPLVVSNQIQLLLEYDYGSPGGWKLALYGRPESFFLVTDPLNPPDMDTTTLTDRISTSIVTGLVPRADAVYHVGIVAETNAKFVTTLSVYVGDGAGPIALDSAAPPKPHAVVSFGVYEPKAPAKIESIWNGVISLGLYPVNVSATSPTECEPQYYDCLRVWDGVPVTFPAID